MADGRTDSLTQAERIFVRINIAQTVLALAGLFTGAVALYAALNESEAVRRQSAAAVWPYVQLSTIDFVNESDALFKVSLTNAGVGPARMEAMRVRIEGAAQADWAEALTRVAGETLAPSMQSSTAGHVIRPGESLDLMATRRPDVVAALQSLVATGGAQLDYCYCSIFDECWTMTGATADPTPERVKKCPDYGDERFRY